MNIHLKWITFAFGAFTLFGCQNNEPGTPPTTATLTKTKELTGNYVSDGYTQRNEGYDWVAVTVNRTSGDSLSISIRSRADQKKPTCTFDAGAQKMDDSTYKTGIDGKNILFSFRQASLDIATEKTEDGGLLNFYCSGGGSLAGRYQKIDGAIDQSQLAPAVSNK